MYNERGWQVDENASNNFSRDGGQGGGRGEWTILGPKRAHTHNSGTFLKFCRVKGANRYMKTLLVVFWEKTSFGTIWSFLPLDYFLLFDWEWSNWAWPLLIGSLNSQDSQDMILKREDTISQINIYVMDIVWMLCDAYVWRSKFMVLQSFFENLLRRFVWI